ncbi:hypothetical protein [Microbispora triticiradicis]|uniref:Uncharacterized protein n=3 Tax=Microbispora TaxID=2005 RepID=A0ABY3LYJ4_9ACTN|nr:MULTISPECIES: hypothetical protein [Microbispora]TLP53117.1 hypothetical protein FED44_30035 [Microbispora fusca]TYB60017.1 hypothetical protein FXF59_13940 [Microbispora tritici]GLW21046.1 hypothetical protein Mame01_10890 [Microbispora amethystogenes]
MRGRRLGMTIGSALLTTVALWPAAGSPVRASTISGGVAVSQAAPGASVAKPKPPKCTNRCTNHRKYKCCPKCKRVKGKC